MSDRDSYLMRKYGITEADYEAMLRKSSGGCWICGYKPRPGGRRLCVDHYHRKRKLPDGTTEKFGKVRGALCHLCNRGLTYWRDNPVRLRAAAEYLINSGAHN